MILTLSCPDRHGIVAAVSAFLLQRDANISDAQQFGDATTGTFFMRVVFELAEGDTAEDARAAFVPLAERFGMDWTFCGPEPRRVMILTSKFDHCLADLLYRWRISEMVDVSDLAFDRRTRLIEHRREAYLAGRQGIGPEVGFATPQDVEGEEDEVAAEARCHVSAQLGEGGTPLLIQGA